MKRKEQIMADLLRSQQDSRARGQQMRLAKEGYSPAQMSSNLPQTMSPNMINQSAGMRPGRTNVGQGRAAALAAQMRQAQANMSGDPAQGKTVSNGRIYVAPTWSEVLADGVKKGLGGYNAGQAREGLIEIDEEQAAEDAMDAEYEAMLLAQQMTREDEEAAQDQLNFDSKAGALVTAAETKTKADIAAANKLGENRIQVAGIRSEGEMNQGLGNPLEENADGRAASFSTALMNDFHDSPNADNVPNVFEYAVMSRAPADIKGYFVDSKIKDAYETRTNWAAQYVLMLSGKVARESEKREVRENFFPIPFDEKEDVLRKRSNRAAAMLRAEQAFLERKSALTMPEEGSATEEEELDRIIGG